MRVFIHLPAVSVMKQDRHQPMVFDQGRPDHRTNTFRHLEHYRSTHWGLFRLTYGILALLGSETFH